MKVLAGLTLSFALSATWAADVYPSRPIQIVVPFAAGGGLDVNARNFAQSFAEALKQPVVVVNRDGAAGTIGLQSVAKAQSDGYTLAFTPAVPLSSEPHRLKSIAYNLESFKYVCQVFDNIFAIAVSRESAYRTVADIVNDAKRKPGSVTYGTSGTGSIPHLGTSDIEAATKIDLTHVPYKGDAPMLQDLLTGRLGFGAVLASSITGYLASGELRLVAVYSDKRHPFFPETPTLQQAGIPVVQSSFGGVLAPAKTPDEIVSVLQAACEKAVRSSSYVERAQRANQVVDYQDGAAFEKRMWQDSQQKASTLKRLGL